MRGNRFINTVHVLVINGGTGDRSDDANTTSRKHAPTG
jgi:hypothetical protein